MRAAARSAVRALGTCRFHSLAMPIAEQIWPGVQ